MITVTLVDDHPLMVEAIASLLLRTGDYQVLATGSAAYDIVEICVREMPQIMIVDLNMPGDVYAAITTVTALATSTRIVVFTAATGVDCAIRALDSGACGYVLKGSSARELIDAVSAVASGRTYIPPQFASRVIATMREASLRQRAPETKKLNIREQQIVDLLLRGKTNKEIAATMRISDKTVRHYMTLLMQKLQVRNRLEVLIAAQKLDTHIEAIETH